MGIRKASYNRFSKSSLNSLREKIKLLSEKIVIPLLVQRKNRAPLSASKTKKDLHIHAQQNEGCSLHTIQFV